MANILIIHHSLHGHTHFLAESIEKGAMEVKGAKVQMRRVQETKPHDLLERLGASEFYESFLTLQVGLRSAGQANKILRLPASRESMWPCRPQKYQGVVRGSN